MELKCLAPGEIGQLALAFRDARPWPHLVVDGVIDATTREAAVREALAIPRASLDSERTRRIRKLATNDMELMGPALRGLLEEMHQEAFVRAVREVTGVDDLVTDPGRLRAGLFITPPGGWQRLHEDFPKHPTSGLWARVIALLYLSEWHVGAGGELDMWSRDMTRSATVQPIAGRLVLCATDSRCRHGVLAVDPAGEPRVAVAARFYRGPHHR